MRRPGPTIALMIGMPSPMAHEPQSQEDDGRDEDTLDREDGGQFDRGPTNTLDLLYERLKHGDEVTAHAAMAIARCIQEMAPMPWQLRNAKRRPRHSEPRPTIESMPSISIHDLRPAIPRYHGQVNEPNVDLKYPDLAYLRLSTFCLEIMGRNGYVQRFRIMWIRTGFGRHRAILVCSSCGGGAIRLFSRYGNYACRFCHKAIYASQKNNQTGRPRLQAAKLRLLQLGGWPDIREPLPAKPKWTRHRTYQRIRNEIQALEATANPRRFRKPIPTQLFAYHIS